MSSVIAELKQNTEKEVTCLIDGNDYNECIGASNTYTYVENILPYYDAKTILSNSIGLAVFNEDTNRVKLLKDFYKLVSHHVIDWELIKNRGLEGKGQRDAAVLLYLSKIHIVYNNPQNIVNLNEINNYTRHADEFTIYSRALRQTRIIVGFRNIWGNYKNMLELYSVEESVDAIINDSLPEGNRLGKKDILVLRRLGSGLISEEQARNLIRSGLKCTLDKNSCKENALIFSLGEGIISNDFH